MGSELVAGADPSTLSILWDKGRDLGFTLLELLVVLLVIGVVTAIAAPSLSRPMAAENAAARKATRLIEYGRYLAAQRGALVLLELDAATGEARVSVWDPARPGFRVEHLDRPVTFRPGALLAPAGGGPYVFRFDPSGRVEGSDIVVTGPAGRRVRPDPWTGRARENH